MERMFEFILYYMYWKKKTAPKKQPPGEQEAYADQLDWL